MKPRRRGEPGYFVILEADGNEIPESRRKVYEGRDDERDERIVHELRASMGPTCEVVFKPDDGVSPF